MSADVTGDGIPDLIAGAGNGGGPRVRVIDGQTGQTVQDFFAFESTFRGGVNVAAGDVDGDGFADLILAPGDGGGPRVKVVSGKDGSVLADFFALADENFRGGVNVAAGDVDGDGLADVIATAANGGGPRLAGFSGASLRPGSTPTKLFSDFFALDSTLRTGAAVAVGDVDGDGRSDIAVSGGPAGSQRVAIFGADSVLSGSPTTLAAFTVADAGLPARIAAKQVDGDDFADLVVGTDDLAVYAGSDLRMGTVPTPTMFDAIPDFDGGVYVG